MNYTELKITLPPEKVEEISNLLVINGFESFEVTDFRDFEQAIDEVFYDYIEDALFEDKNKLPEIRIYFDEDNLLECVRLKKILAENPAANMTVEESTVKSEDWEDNWKKYFFPFPVGEKLYVKPTWLDAGEDSAGRKIMDIDPASAFGSGTHAPTKLCLEYVEKFVKPGDRVLDMGCGSGILGIGAAMLGAGAVTAVDIDENAVRIAGENFAQNGIEKEKVTVLCGDALSDRDFADKVPGENNLIAANIVAFIIKELSGFFLQKLRAGGILVASGIISERTEEVKDALTAAGFEFVKLRTEADWTAMVLKKPEGAS